MAGQELPWLWEGAGQPQGRHLPKAQAAWRTLHLRSKSWRRTVAEQEQELGEQQQS